MNLPVTAARKDLYLYLPLLPALMLVLFGVAVAIGGWQYGTGTLTAMGPGFMPALCGALLSLLGAVLLVSEWRQKSASILPSLPLRPMLCAAGSVLLWALSAEYLGFVPAALLQLLLASLAVTHQHWGRVLAVSVLVTVLAYGVFVMLLGIPLQAFGF